MRKGAIFSLAAGVIGFILLTGGQRAGAENLVANSGFEEGANGQPAAWSFMPCTNLPDIFDAEWSDESHQGKRSIKIIARNSTGKASAYWIQTVNVKPSTKYLATAWMKATKAWVLLWTVGLDAAGNAAPPGDPLFLGNLYEGMAFRQAGTEEAAVLEGFVPEKYISALRANTWGTVSLPFTTKPGMTKISLRIGSYFLDGTMWFDDISLEEVQ